MNQILTSALPSENVEPALRAWRAHLAALGAVLALILLEFHHAVFAAVTVWVVSPTYSHCFLIIPIVAWLIWEKRQILREITPEVEFRALLIIVPLLIIWWFGQLLSVNEIIQYAIVGMMLASIVALLGVRVARQIWFPLFFLLFLVPTGEYLTGPMQRFATEFVDVCLNLIGIPHYTEGTVIELTNGRFEIAEACAGLRFLIATVTLSVLFAYLMYRRIYKVVLLLVASVIIPLIGNGLRCLGIILLAHFTSNKYGAGADHIIYGWGFNVAILFAVIFVGAMFRDPPAKSVEERESFARQPDRMTKIAFATILGGMLISVGPAWALWGSRDNAILDKGTLSGSLQAAGWHKGDADDSWHPNFSGADIRLREARRDGIEPIDLFIGYYARPRAGETVTAQPNKLWDDRVSILVGGGQVGGTLDGSPLELSEYVISSGNGRRVIWSVYWAHGIITNSPLRVRLLAARAALIGKEGQAVIAFSTPLDDSLDVVRARLSRALSSLGRISQSLESVKPSPQAAG